MIFFNVDDIFKNLSLNILKLLGTPTEETWPGMTQLPDYKVITLDNVHCINLNDVLDIIPPFQPPLRSNIGSPKSSSLFSMYIKSNNFIFLNKNLSKETRVVGQSTSDVLFSIQSHFANEY